MREGNVFSLSTPVGEGGYHGQVQTGGGTQPGPAGVHLPSDLAGGVPLLGGTPLWVPHGQTWPGGTHARGVPHLGYPPSDLTRGYPCQGGYPTSGTSPSDLAGGYPCWGYLTSGTPCQTWSGGPPVWVPHLGYTPITPGWGVPLAGRGTPLLVTDGVFDTLRSVCLLRLTQEDLLCLGNSFAHVSCTFYLSKCSRY